MKNVAVEMPLADTAALMQFAAGLFGRPLDEASRDFLLSIDADGTDPVLAEEACASGLAAIQAALSGSEDALADTSVSFHRLFVGPQHLPCPPWGSVYLDGGRLFGPSSQQVARQFATHGFALSGSSNEPSDHIAYELAFLAELIKGAAALDEAGDADGARAAAEEALRFQADFIESWFPAFAASVKQEDETGFYSGAADLVQGLLSLSGLQLSSFAEEQTAVQ